MFKHRDVRVPFVILHVPFPNPKEIEVNSTINPLPVRRALIENQGGRQSNLDPILTDIPWNASWDIGSGIDAITGGMAIASAIKPSPVERAPINQAFYSGRLIRNESQFAQELDVNLNAKFNIGSVDVTASTKYLQKISYSELSLTIVVRYKTAPDAYDLMKAPELTAEARELLADPAAFRKRYGDYFVEGARRTSEFIAIYNLYAKSSEKVREFEASIGVVSTLLTAEGTTRLKDLAKKNELTINCSVDYVGITEQPTLIPNTPDEIRDALEWFKDHNEGVRETARLVHFSRFSTAYPTTVDVPPDVFVDLHMLYRSLWLVRAYHTALPKVYKDRFADDVIALQLDITTNKPTLPHDSEQRQALAARASDLRADLEEVIERRDFFELVKQTIAEEPKKDATQSAARSQYTWTYGYASYPGSLAVTISPIQRDYKETARAGWRQDTLELHAREGVKIVGWEVRSNWRDNTNGQWWKVSDKILGQMAGQVHVKSAHLRGCDWSVIFYTVPAEDYLFD